MRRRGGRARRSRGRSRRRGGAPRRTAAGSRARHLGLVEVVELGESSTNQRGKNVVSASSGNTTSSQPRRGASRSRASSRSTTSLRAVVALRSGPAGPPPTCERSRRHVSSPSSARRSSTCEQDVGAGREVGGLGVLGRVVADARRATARRSSPAGHTRASIWASWPAPDGSRARVVAELPRRRPRRGRPHAVVERTGSKRASDARRRRSTPSSRAASVDERRASVGLGAGQHVVVGVAQVDGERRRAPATTLTRFGVQRRCRPTVPTWRAADVGGQLAHVRSRSGRRRSPASWRSAIGVVPAWFDWPAMVSSCQEMPCTPVTRRWSKPSASSTGPCSMCSSTNAWGTARARQRAQVADALELVAEHGRRRCRRCRSASSSGHAADVDEAAEHVGREAGALLVGEERRRRAGGAGSMPARSSVSITSSPASTPRLPS